MAKYVVRVEDILSRSFIVEADSVEEAESKMSNAYHNEDFILDGADWIDYTIENDREADAWDIENFEHLADYL